MANIDFTGNVGQDSTLRFTKDNTPVLGFTVSDSQSRKLDNGEWETLRQQWFNVSVFGPLAEVLAETVRKGTRVRVVGDFWRRDYESNNGGGVSLDVKAIGVDVIPKRGEQRQQQGGSAFGGGQQQSGQNDPWGGGQSTGGSWGTPDDGPAF